MGLWDDFTSAVSSVAHAISEPLGNVVDRIIGAINDTINAIEEYFGVNIVGDPVQECPYPEGPPAVCALMVHVKRRNGGQPIAGADVRIDGEQALNAVTDDSGNAYFDDIRAGDYEVYAIADGFNDAFTNKYCQENTTNTAELDLVSSAYGLTELSVPEYLAPGMDAAQEPFAITYTIDDPGQNATRAVLEVYRKGNDATPIWKKNFEGEAIREACHEFKWDGKLDPAPAEFPDGYVTIEHSPYKIKMKLEGSGTPNPSEQEKSFKIEVTKIELKLGPKAQLTTNRDKNLRDAIGSVPASGSTKKVHLISNLYKTGNGEMSDNTAFTQYKNTWRDGPNIPILAQVFVKASTGAEVCSPRALGKTKFVWDWEPVAEDTSTHHNKAKLFINAARNYYKDTTNPKGVICHKDRGGKRGGPTPVFPAQLGTAPAASPMAGAWPFKVTACSTRTWAAFSQGWSGGSLGGHTGVIFEPSRMAGDGWKISVNYKKLNDDGSHPLDTAGALAPSHKAESGTFEIWRTVFLAKYMKKTSNVTDFNVGTFRGYYRPAKVNIQDNTGGSSLMSAATYNAQMTTAVNNSRWYRKLAVDSSVDQHAAGDHAVDYRSYADFKTAVKTDKGWTDAQLNTWLSNNNLETSSKYHGALKEWAKALVSDACDPYMSSNNGINIFQWIGLYNLETQPGGRQINGSAVTFPSSSRTKCAFIQCAGPGAYGGGNFNTAEQTITHEIGHHLFLPHAPNAGGNQPNRHDDAWNNCIMSYHYDKERLFCGLCILRLRGWDATALNKTAANNTKP